MSLGGTKAGRHTSLIKYIILKSGYSHENSSKAKAHGQDRKPLLIHYNHMEMSVFSVLEKKKKKTLDDLFFESHGEKYCMALNIGSCQSTVRTTEIRIYVETRRIICLFNVTVQMSLSKA